MSYYGFPKYVCVADRKRKAQQQINKLCKKGEKLNPILIEGRVIASSFWGKAWCKHLEKFKDQDYRLERGRSYLRSNSVIDLEIKNHTVHARVIGSSNYGVRVEFSPVSQEKWKKIVSHSTGKIDSLVSLLKGDFSKEVMAQMIEIDAGLFPGLHEVTIKCSCPDWSALCKHSAAVLYGIGHRLDSSPELLFTLRAVNHLDLLKIDSLENFVPESLNTNLDGDLSAIFGIDLVEQLSNKEKEKRTRTRISTSHRLNERKGKVKS